ncbi:MAG: DsrE family protein [Sedimentisphaerales bacterium]|nr:DsrE family protein [Sedimentisphaerales bacterium]
MSHKKQCDLQVIIASGPRDVGRAVLGFAFGASAAVSNIRVKVILALDGTAWAKKNEPAAKKGVKGFSPITEYMNILARSGAVISVCSTCSKNACLTQRGAKGSRFKFPAVGLSELALATSNGRASIVVF